MAVYSIKRSDLIAALDAVKGAIPKKSFQPILTHVAFDSGVVWGFDSEVGVRAKLDFQSRVPSEPPEFNAPFERFYNLMKTLNESEVEFDIDDNKVKIACGRHRSVMHQIVEDKFPKPPMDDGLWRDVPTGFKEALEKALLATSDREQEKLLSSVRIKDKSVQSTDRAKAVRCMLDGSLGEKPMLLNRKACLEIIRLGNPIKMMVLNDAWSIWDYGNLQFVARLREGANEFPPIDMLFEQDFLKEVKLDLVPEGLVAILTRLKYLAGEEKSFTVRDGMGRTELLAQSETTQCVEDIDVMYVEGPKKFPIDAVMEAVPYAEQMSWLGRNQPLYIKGKMFEWICMPAVIGG